MFYSTLIYVGLILTELLVIARAILRPHRDPASRIAWVIVIAVISVLGVIVYVLLGETNIGRRRIERSKEVLARMPALTVESGSESNHPEADIPEPYDHLFRTAHSISGFPTVGGNSAQLFSVSDETIGSMVNDIDAAQDHVHLLFYIWLTDNNGLRVADALRLAAARGVTCRAMADSLGSRLMIGSEHWEAMKDAGVHLGVALPIGNPFLRPLHGRIDLRNHRKIVVIDHRITYCGSQNCADAEFRLKPKFAPWVDAVMRFNGPIAQQNQHLFVSDWMTYVDEDLVPMLNAPVKAETSGFAAQAFGTGPTVRHSAMPEMFESLMFAARREIVITTPYYVPDESMQNALCAAARRGVDTTIVFPARNDSSVVSAASHSYYADLLAAGVKIREYVGGLLHTKSFTIDEVVTLIGSANMDRRSFDLNYENNILLYDAALTADMRRLQEHYISKSNAVTNEIVSRWPVRTRLWNNAIAMLGPVL
ncbi:MAG: cardiolipin synthase [Fuerstiella sp.]|nr:cardiolipin synthase [Fuerstiella sp.]MCP4855623.1 cardiolipin synthase [Fuerstiella sp.]